MSRKMRTAGQYLTFVLLTVTLFFLSNSVMAQTSATWTQLGKRLKASPFTFAEKDVSRHVLSPSLAGDADSTYLSWVELNKHGIPQVHVHFLNKGSWTPLGDSLNMDPDHPGFDAAMAVDQSEPYVAWIELNKEGIPQLHVKRWTMGSWTLAGKTLNHDPNQPAANPSIHVAGGKVYLAWVEENKDRVYQAHVKTLTESGWVSLGDILNRDPKKNAIDPTIHLIGSTPYIVWCEKGPHDRFQVFVEHWNGEAWKRDGSHLNIDPSSHAVSPSLSSDGLVPYVASVEFNSETVAQVQVKRLKDGKWVRLGQSLNMDRDHHALSPTISLKNGIPFVAWAEYNSEGLPQIHVKRWTDSEWVFDKPILNLDPSKPASSPTLTVAQGKIYAAWKEADSTGLYNVVVKIRKE